MKKVLLTIMTFGVLAFCMEANAQIKTPAPSPGCKLEATVGLTTITVEYSRPSMKGRAIFGGLVPYGEMWRTGANKNTMVTFSDDVTIGGKDVKKGTYALFTVPGKDEWEIILYTDTENWGTPEKWDATKEAVRLKSKVETMSMPVETFTLDIGNLENDACKFGILWEKTWVDFDIKLKTDERVAADIKKVMGGPNADDYYAAGRYYFEAGKDINQAYEWMHKSNEMDAKFWKLRQESLILAKMGKYKDAIAVAEKSKSMAIEAKNKDYERMNTESITEWKAMK